jgi:hypothetical protein
MNRAWAALLAVVLASACIAAPIGPARAQSDIGEIDILIVDSASQEPLGNARTVLLGPQTANTLTTSTGLIRFTDVPTGIYRIRVQRQGYDAGVSREFDVLPDRAVQVRVELVKRAPGVARARPGASPNPGESPSGLKTIAVVSAKSHIDITSIDINENSPMRRISDSLTDALNNLAGVNVTSDSTDPTSAVTISLHNQDESQTSLTLDGIPLSAPGVAGNLRGIGTDLFSGSRVSFSPQAGGLAGGVNFRTLEPTQAMTIRASGSTGTFDRSNYSIAGTGSINSLGIAVQHTWRGANSPLTFQDYEDQSGLTYPHGGESTTMGDFVKFRYRLGDERTTISGTALTTNRDAYAICARDVTILPCGIGPDNRSYGRYAFGYTTIQSLVGNIQTTFSAYTNSSVSTTDDVNRFILDPTNNYDPTLDPSLSTNNAVTRGVSYSASIAQGHHTFSLGGTTYASISTSTPLAGSVFEVPFTNAASSTTYRFSDAIKSNDALSFTPQISLANTTGLGTSFLGGLSATWSPRPANAFALSLSVGSSQPNLSGNRSYSDPNAARFDCSAQTAIVGGPGDTGGSRQTAAALTAAFSHTFNGGATVSVDAYSQVQSGQLISALIQEPLSFYPAGYLPVLYSAYRAPTVCGAAAPLPTLFAQESVAGTARAYRGFDIQGRFALSPYIQVLPTYSLNLATLTAASSRLQDGPTTTIVGAELPGRPIHRAGLTIDGLWSRTGIEMIANAQYTGANNNQNLGPYVVTSFGVSHKFGPGVLTLFENNAFNTYAGDFSSDTFAQPRLLTNGQLFYTAATPLTPRTIFLSYSTVIGGPAPGPAFKSLVRGNQVASAPGPSPSPRGRNAQRVASYPPPDGTDPLTLAGSRPGCDADMQTAATPVLAAVREYVTAYEAGATPVPIPNVNVVAHKPPADAGIAYFLELRANLPRPPGAQGNGNGSGGGARAPRVGGGAGAPGGAGGGGGGFGGFGGGEGGAPGGPGGPGGGAQPGGAGAADSPQAAAARKALQTYINSPEVRAYRGFTSCTYITLLTATEAKAKGIVTENGRPGMYYVPKLGFVFVQALQLPTGGGSLKQGK